MGYYRIFFPFAQVLVRSTFQFTVPTVVSTCGVLRPRRLPPGRRRLSAAGNASEAAGRRAAGGAPLLGRAAPRAFGETALEREGAVLGGNRKAKVNRVGAQCAGAGPGIFPPTGRGSGFPPRRACGGAVGVGARGGTRPPAPDGRHLPAPSSGLSLRGEARRDGRRGPGRGGAR